MKIAIINGPNLNLLGKREPEIYGNKSFEDFLKELQSQYTEQVIDYFQSNEEGVLVNHIQKVAGNYDFLIVNGASLSHTSIALGDALAAINIPYYEVHISNVFKRESFRHHSYLSAAAAGVIIGCGLDSYRLAMEAGFYCATLNSFCKKAD